MTWLLVVGAKLGRRDHLIDFKIFTPGGMRNLEHADGLTLASNQEDGVEGDVADVAAGNLQTGQLLIVKLVERGVRRKYLFPDTAAAVGIGKGKTH